LLTTRLGDDPDEAVYRQLMRVRYRRAASAQMDFTKYRGACTQTGNHRTDSITRSCVAIVKSGEVLKG